MTKLLNIRFAGVELLTGLPEYRNGGLFVDTGLLTLKEHDAQRGRAAFRSNALLKGQQATEVIPLFATDDDVIVEWRAVTVGLLDELLIEVNGLLGLRGSDQLTLAQMLEAGSWKVSKSRNKPDFPGIATKTQLGRSRTSRGFKAQLEGATNYDIIGWDGILSE